MAVRGMVSLSAEGRRAGGLLPQRLFGPRLVVNNKPSLLQRLNLLREGDGLLRVHSMSINKISPANSMLTLRRARRELSSAKVSTFPDNAKHLSK